MAEYAGEDEWNRSEKKNEYAEECLVQIECLKLGGEGSTLTNQLSSHMRTTLRFMGISLSHSIFSG
jgi:hypothetical protein